MEVGQAEGDSELRTSGLSLCELAQIHSLPRASVSSCVTCTGCAVKALLEQTFWNYPILSLCS